MMARMVKRIRQDGRIQIALALGVTILFVTVIIASRYGTSGIEDFEGERRVYSDGEHCALILPDEWGWRAASWTAVSPNGTILGFSEEVYGRPENPEWEEVSEAMIQRTLERGDATVEADDDTVRIDFGADGGLSILQRFDRVGCLLSFSGTGEKRAEEEAVWEEIIASLVRTSPTDTPEENLPWKTD